MHILFSGNFLSKPEQLHLENNLIQNTLFLPIMQPKKRTNYENIRLL